MGFRGFGLRGVHFRALKDEPCHPPSILAPVRLGLLSICSLVGRKGIEKSPGEETQISLAISLGTCKGHLRFRARAAWRESSYHRR